MTLTEPTGREQATRQAVHRLLVESDGAETLVRASSADVRQRIAGLIACEDPLLPVECRDRVLAQVLNDVVPKALGLLDVAQRPRVVHQAGMKHIEALKAAYAAASVEADIRPFIDDMAAAYGDCDLLICRAGALTVAEICAAGIASVLVPFRHAVDDHQTGNARFLSDVGAAVLIPQLELTPQRLADLIKRFTREQLQQMATKARALAKPDATEQVAKVCMELAHAA